MQFIKRYIEDQSGNFAMMFALVASMLLFAVAVAIDYSSMTRQSSRLQNLSDSAVLAATLSGKKTIPELQIIVDAALKANNTTGLDVKATVSVVNDAIRVDIDAPYTSMFAGVMGDKPFGTKSAAESPFAVDSKFNIALVLDKTYSMKGANLDALKTASTTLTDAFDGQGDDRIQVSVVPFANYVNIGMGNRYKTWMNVEEDTSEPYCYSAINRERPELCTTETNTCYNDGVPFECTTSTCPPEAYGEPYEYCTTSTSTWRGCAGSRDNGLNVIEDYQGDKIPGVMNSSCGSDEVMELTSNMADVKAKIQSLTPYGATYVPSGLIWGWRMLDAQEPFGNLSNDESGRQRVLILMTDGENTVRLTTPYHYNMSATSTNFDTDKAETDALTDELCTKIKAEGIKIYSVAYAFDADNTSSKNLIRDCASSTSNFYEPNNVSQLENTFEDIVNSLKAVRLSR